MGVDLLGTLMIRHNHFSQQFSQQKRTSLKVITIIEVLNEKIKLEGTRFRNVWELYSLKDITAIIITL